MLNRDHGDGPIDLLFSRNIRKGANSLAFRKFDGRDRPLPIVAPDRDSQAVQFVKPYILYRTGLPIGQHHGFADQLSLGLFKRTEDG